LAKEQLHFSCVYMHHQYCWTVRTELGELMITVFLDVMPCNLVHDYFTKPQGVSPRKPQDNSVRQVCCLHRRENNNNEKKNKNIYNMTLTIYLIPWRRNADLNNPTIRGCFCALM
jgi:hypothetical protein